MITRVGLVLVLIGCTQPADDAPTDPAPTPDTPEVEVAPRVGARAFVIGESDVEELEGSYLTGARIGDIVLINDHVRFVVRAGPEALVLAGPGGGSLIDAGPPAADRLQELLPMIGFSTLSESTVTIEDDGTNGAAVVRVVGKAAPPPLLASYLPGIGVEGSLEHTWRLEDDARWIESTTTLESDATDEQLVGDLLFVGGDIESAISEAEGWLASEGPDVSYGIVSETPLSVADFGGIAAVLGPDTAPPVTWTRYLVVGDGSMSSVVDAMLELRMTPSGRVTGTVDDPTATVSAVDGTDALVSRFRPDAEGRFEGRLPVGLYTLIAEGPGRIPGPPETIVVQEGAEATAVVTAATPGALTVTVAAPTRIVLEGDGKRVQAIGPGTTTLPVPPGSWTATATRGFEWSHDQTTLTIEAGATATWTPTLEHVVDTTGWIAADFHLHSEWSADSNVPLTARVLSCAAEGIEYAVATDHDVVTDYTEALPPELAEYLVVGAGVEVSSQAWGHLNVWPLELDESKAGRGAPRWHGLDFDGLMDRLAPETPGRVVQVNHGRGGNGFDTLDALNLDPTNLDDETANRMRFTAMELFNGVTGDFDELLIDWLALLEKGRPVAATGTSDSHSLTSYCGHGRTMVRTTTRDPKAIDQAVRAQQTMVTSGPFVTLEEAPNAQVHLRIQAPSYIPTTEVTIYADGKTDTTLTLEETKVLRYDAPVPLQNPDATRIVAVVRGGAPVAPMAKESVFAVSAPLFR